MKAGRLQAKDIADEFMLDAVRDTQGMHGVPDWSSLWDVEARVGLPPKLVRAKLSSLIRRGKLHGCACGCRGDFRFPTAAA